MGAAALPLSMGLGAIGTGIQAKGAYDQGVEAQRAAKINAARMRATAADVERIANVEAGGVRTDATKIIGEQRAMVGASGIDTSVGSVVDMAAYTRAQAELDAQKLKNNAAREAWGIRTQAAEVQRQGRAAKTAGKMQAIGTILGGASSMAGGFAGYKGGG